MKYFSFFLFLIVLLFSSCRIEKRLYSSGFYIDRKEKNEHVSSYSNKKIVHARADSAANDSAIVSTDTLFPAEARTEIPLVVKLKKEIHKPLRKMQSSPVYQHLPDPIKKSKFPQLILEEKGNDAQNDALIMSLLGLVAVLVLLGFLVGFEVELSILTILLALLSPFIILAAIWMSFGAISKTMKNKDSPDYRKNLKISIAAMVLAIFNFFLLFAAASLFVL